MGEDADQEVSGLCVKGLVAGRQRRNVGERKVELAAYTIKSKLAEYHVKDWAPSEYLKVGEKVELPVAVKAFPQKGGQCGLEFTILRGRSSFGEEF
jgi:hypothetical protein